MDELTTIAGKWYPNQLHQAFLHWSMSCLLADRNVTDEEIIEHICMDGRGDLGIDGYWIDEENGQLILVQSKYSAIGIRPRRPQGEPRASICRLKPRRSTSMCRGMGIKYPSRSISQIFKQLFWIMTIRSG